LNVFWKNFNGFNCEKSHHSMNQWCISRMDLKTIHIIYPKWWKNLRDLLKNSLQDSHQTVSASFFPLFRNILKKLTIQGELLSLWFQEKGFTSFLDSKSARNQGGMNACLNTNFNRISFSFCSVIWLKKKLEPHASR